MKFKEIDAFRAVMRSGSMTAAAADLYTSQPNVSRLIAQLETSTGLDLFTRQAGRLLPTEEALAFLREVDRAFVGLDALKDAARNIRHFGKGRLRIATVPSLAMTVLPLVLQKFHADHPEVTVAMDTASSTQISEWVAGQVCDLGLVSYLSGPSATDAEPVCDVAACCVLPPGHRLATLPFIEPADLAGEPFISLSHGDGLRALVDAAFAADDRRVLHFETPYGATICQMVGLGLGVSITNPLVAHNYRHMGIHVLPFRPAIPFVSYLLLPRHRPANGLVERFIALTRQVVAHELGVIGG
jgi:DNA-binding transcriptional LysR family regulator